MVYLVRLLCTFIFLISSHSLVQAQTASGTDITTALSIGYTISSVSQSETLTSQTFETSKKVDLAVSTTEGNGTEKIVTPSQTSTFTKFTILNEGNYTSSYTFVASITDTDDVFVGAPSVTVWTDGANNNCESGAGDDSQITTFITLAAAASEGICIYTTDDVNATAAVTQNDEADFILTATATDSGTTTATTATAGAYDKTVVQTVFSDGDGPVTGENLYDGKHSAIAQVKVYKSALSVALVPSVVYDNNTGGFTCATRTAAAGYETDAKAIPGSCMDLAYTLTNGAGGATANAIDWTIDLPGELTYVAKAGFGYDNDAGATCNDTGNLDITNAASTGVLICNITSLAASASVTVRIRATIN